MKRTVLFIIAAAMLFGNCVAQESKSSKSLRASFMYIESATLSYGSIPGEIRSYTNHVWGYAVMIDADLWQLSRNFTAGIHLGFSPSSYDRGAASSSASPTVVGVHYGVDLSYNLLPDCNRWNLTFNGTLGSYWTVFTSPHVSYGASVRAEYFPLDHFGVFAEIGWGKYYFTRQEFSTLNYGETMAKIGLAYRL